MSIARHHAEWLSLLEISGPFLSLPVLMEAFPQGLDADDPERTAKLRAVYEEWADNQGGLQPDLAIHHAWIRYILGTVLELDELGEELLLEGQAIPSGLKATVAEHHETLRPDLILREPEGGTRLLVQTCPPAQKLDKPLAERNWKASPATRMMELLHATEVRLGLVTNGEHWLLVQAKRGESTGFISWYAPLWTEERLTLRAFRSLLGAYRFFGVPQGQTLEVLLDDSAKDQQEVTDQLGYQVRHAVEILVQAIDLADQDRGRLLLADVSETLLYETAVTVMMRLVFLFAAEERGLLLLNDPIYDQNYAVSTLRAQLRETANQYGEDLLERRYDAWSRLLATFRAVYGGVQHENMRLMAYGGSLFDPDRFPFLEGRVSGTLWQTSAADPLPIDNRTVLHLLEALQMLQVKTPGGGPAQARRLSFRALDIEQIGHVYEGLLDHTAVRADAPVLGLQGTQDKEPEIALPRLEAYLDDNGKLLEGNLDGLLAFLKDESGRSLSALGNGLQSPIDDPQVELNLRVACGNDDALLQRVLPWSGLVREDDYGHPVIIPAGSVYVTAGQTRRSTGAHYTPRILTEPIVQHTLEPLVYIGPAAGKPRAEWLLRTPAEILALKLCDMAIGSGAFLVQACRYLSERLVEAWEIAGANQDSPAITPEGKPATGDPAETIIPVDIEEQLALARRLVADRCLYGVDKNALAVEMTKLSLWLITLDKNRPFTFLDHALKHGDSLIGADEERFNRWAHSILSQPGHATTMSLFDELNRQMLAKARKKRKELQEFTVQDVRDAAEKARLNREAETAMAQIKLGCDLLVGVRFLGHITEKEKQDVLARAQLDYAAGREISDPDSQHAQRAAKENDAFHWPFEFPEVFQEGGFSTFIGNPPFIGGQRIRAAMGGDYLHYLKATWDHAKGSADYSAYFFLQGFANLRRNGCMGLIATNTISQGDTLELGLDYIHRQGGEIFRAYNDYLWPGKAAVVVDIVHIQKGSVVGKRVLDDVLVNNITPMLDDMPIYGKPNGLAANAGKSFQGSNVLGLGFTMPLEEAEELIARNPSNKDVLKPYLIGKDLNSSPTQAPSRWVINFFDWPLERTATGTWATADEKQKKLWLRNGKVPKDYFDPVAADYPDCLNIVREKVYPERAKNRNKQRREIWWRFTRPTIELYQTIAPLGRVLALTIVSRIIAFSFVESGQVYAHRLALFATEKAQDFALLQSNFHYHWAWMYSSTLKQDLNYSPTDVYQTFPFPKLTRNLENTGQTYHSFRSKLMKSRQEGLTSTYNRFHDMTETSADIVHLRALHVEMDNVVAVAYGWSDLDLGHGFHETPQGSRYTICEPARREVLIRLLKLNHERYEEEVKLGLYEQKTKRKVTKRKKTTKKNDGQLSLF